MEAAAKNAEEMQQENSTQQAAATNVVYSTDPKAKKLSCSRCLGTGHNQAMCKYKTAKCNKCHKVGHLARACYRPVQPRRQDQRVNGQHTGQSNKGHVRQVSNNPSKQVTDIVTIYTVTEGLPRSYKVIMEVNKQPIEMELDTGAIVSLVSEVLGPNNYTSTLPFCFERISQQQTRHSWDVSSTSHSWRCY